MTNRWMLEDVPDAVSALAVIDNVKPDLIITDYKMPVLNGLEFLKTIRGGESYRVVPVIFLTAKMDIEADVNDPFVKILHKPFSFAVLINCISTMLISIG